MVVHFMSEDAKRAAHNDAKELFETHHDPRSVRRALEEKHGPVHSADALHRFDEKHVGFKREDVERNTKVLSFKETGERLAFGLGNLQLLNVLLITVIPNVFIAGIILAFRSIATGFVESGYLSFAKRFDGERTRSFWFGNALGYSFILAAIFITLQSISTNPVFTALFALSFLMIGAFGALYLQSGLRLKTGSINKYRMNHYLKWISYYGIVLVAAVFLIAGVVLDLYSEPVVIENLLPVPLFIYGHAILLFITGILVLLTAYLSTCLRRVKVMQEGAGTGTSYVRSMMAPIRETLSQGSFTTSMLAAGVVFYSAQLALNYYLGIHLYLHFEAFTPVAVLFAATLLTMFVVPLFFDKKTLRLNGRSSLFLFGAGLALFIPLVFALVHTPIIRAGLVSLLAPTIIAPETAIDFLPMLYLLIGIAGSSIAGIAFSRLALDTMKPVVRSRFMRSLGILTPLSSGVLILVVFGLRALTQSPLSSFIVLAVAFLVAIVIFASLISHRLEERFEHQALAPHKV